MAGMGRHGGSGEEHRCNMVGLRTGIPTLPGSPHLALLAGPLVEMAILEMRGVRIQQAKLNKNRSEDISKMPSQPSTPGRPVPQWLSTVGQPLIAAS